MNAFDSIRRVAAILVELSVVLSFMLEWLSGWLGWLLGELRTYLHTRVFEAVSDHFDPDSYLPCDYVLLV